VPTVNFVMISVDVLQAILIARHKAWENLERKDRTGSELSIQLFRLVDSSGETECVSHTKLYFDLDVDFDHFLKTLQGESIVPHKPGGIYSADD